MAFWERVYWAAVVSILLAGGYYFFEVGGQTLATGSIAAPSLKVFLTYIILQVVLMVVMIVGLTVLARMLDSGDPAPEQPDERDRMIKTRSEAGASHVTATVIVIALLAYFRHQDGALLFHSALAALMLGELSRCVLQIISYRRGV